MKGGSPIRKIKTYIQKVSVEPISPASGDNCDLYFTAGLVNIQPALSALSTGNYLKIEALTGSRIALYDTSHQLCGILDSAYNDELLQCLSSGNRYRGRLRHDRSSVDVQRVR